MARNYRSEYDNYHAKPEARADNNARKKARRLMEKLGRVEPGDGKDVDHKKPLIKGGANTVRNLTVKSKKTNRSFKRTKNAGMK